MGIGKYAKRFMSGKMNRTVNYVPDDARRFEIENQLRKAFSKSTTSGIGTLFSTNSIVILTAFTTFALQFISFLTTMFGAEFYFSGIFFAAPLLFALAIQCTVYFLSNSLRGKVSVAKVVALLLATICSNYFSYVGIYNVVNSPENYLRDDYSRISTELNDSFAKLKTQAKSDTKQNISNLVSTIGNVFTASTDKLARINSVKADIDTLLKQNNQAALPTPPARPAITGDAEVDAKNKAAYQTALENYQNQINAGLNTASSTVQQRLGLILAQMGPEYTQENLLNDLVTYTSIVQLTQTTLDSVNGTLGTANAGNYPAIISDLRRMSTDETANNKMVSVVPMLISLYGSYPSAPEIAQQEYNTNAIIRLYELAYEKKTSLMKDYPTIRKEVVGGSRSVDFYQLKTALDAEISAGLTEINRFHSYNEDYVVFNATDERYAMYDIYTYPIKVLSNPALRGNAISCLIMALLIDWLTIVFAVLARKHGGVLSATENEDLTVWNETLTEEIAIASMLVEKGMQSARTNYMTESLDHLSAFIRKFSINYSFMDDSGYILWARRSDLEENKVLLTYLCQFNYARIVPREYFIEMLKDGSGQNQDISWLDAQKHDEYVLLKTKFVLWFVQKFSVLASMEELQEAVRHINRQPGEPELDPEKYQARSGHTLAEPAGGYSSAENAQATLSE